MEYIHSIQNFLDFEYASAYPSFSHKLSVGRFGVAGFILGLSLGTATCGTISIAIIQHLISTSVSKFVNNFLSSLFYWCLYLSLLSLFHFLEFLITAIMQPRAVSYDSFIINHSPEYTLAFLASMTEYWIESILFGSYKNVRFIHFTGLALILLGQSVRSIAMWTCGENFSHIVKIEKDEDHKLVTTGIYAYLRHPSYFGWFYWSIGTQLLLCNPICAVAYTVFSWKFFANRIPVEELALLRFYRARYEAYMRSTIIGIPYVPTILEKL